MTPAYFSLAFLAIFSAAQFTQPTVLITQISLRVPTRPSARLYPCHVRSGAEAGAGRAIGSYAYSSVPSGRVLRLCEWIHAPASTSDVVLPIGQPYLCTTSPSRIAC